VPAVTSLRGDQSAHFARDAPHCAIGVRLKDQTDHIPH